MASPKYCNLCQRNIIPQKKFNWLVFIFLCGIFYIPVYLFQQAKCPICKAANFGPAKADKMG